MYKTFEGLVLRETEYRDADKLLTVLTRDAGKLTLKARGVRSNRSRLKGACQILTYSEFTVQDAFRGQYAITEATAKQMFPGLRNDLERLSLASYFAQVAECVCQEDAFTPELLSLTLNSLYALSRLQTPQRQVKAAFELRVACLAGYTPELGGCAVCGAQAPDRLNVSQGVLQCAGCRSDALEGLRLPVSAGTQAAMRYIAACPLPRLLSFQLSASALQELSNLTETYLMTQLERGFSTLDFYKSILPHQEANF